MELIRNAALSYQVDHLGHLVAASGHDKAYAVGLLQHACCGLYEVLRSLLHRDTTQEGHQFVLALRLLELLGMCQRLYGVVYRRDLTRILTVFLNHGLTRQVAHAHDMIGLVHTAFLDSIYRRVHVAAAAVKVGRMHVDHQRLARDMLCKHTGRIGQPVVRVDNVEVQRVSQHRSHGLVVADLLDQVVRVTTRETDATQVIRTDTAIVVADAVAEMIVLLRRHLALHALAHVVVVVVFPYYRNAVCSDDAQKRLIFVAPRLRNDKRDMHVFLLCHTTSQSVAGRTETS